MNGAVHFLDLTAVILLSNEQGPQGWVREDIDNNGDINFLDLIIISVFYNEQWKS
jgi:hypothetical protein